MSTIYLGWCHVCDRVFVVNKMCGLGHAHSLLMTFKEFAMMPNEECGLRHVHNELRTVKGL